MNSTCRESGNSWTYDDECGPTAKSAIVEDVFVANADTSNGTTDYFKYDPDGGTDLAQPHLTFDIEDADLRLARPFPRIDILGEEQPNTGQGIVPAARALEARCRVKQ